ncbi:MAG: DUF2384 domain-containing protein [Chitinophagaceae bacterium]|nr:DUF2384 domain-containing protein [Chitinophagaceae bacterium]
MKKKLSKVNTQTSKSDYANESEVAYVRAAKKSTSKQIISNDFVYSNFKIIADEAPFTVGEWADILHISERTLHRYAKDNSVFNGMQEERILHIKKLITLGNDMFGKEGFKNWLLFKPFSLNNQKPLDLLTSYQGIQNVIDLLGKMQHGISA